MAAGSQQALNRVGETYIDESGKRRRWSRGHQRALPDRLDSGDVEGGMDTHGVRELEPHGRRVNDPLDRKGTGESVSLIPPREEGDLVGRRPGTVSVVRGGIPLSRAKEGSPCLGPGSVASGDEDLDGQTGYLFL